MGSLWEVYGKLWEVCANFPSGTHCNERINGKLGSFLKKVIPPVQKIFSFLYEALAKVFSCWVWMANKLAAQARL